MVRAGSSLPTRPRLYLIVPITIETPDPALLRVADIAAVLLRLPQAEPRALLSRIKAWADIAQAEGAALLLDGHPDLVARGGADGAHLSGLDAFREAAASLKPQRIAGIGGLATRHDAMTAGEAGADYVMFGEPDEHGSTPSAQAVIERVEWWAEVFELPCVGYAGHLDHVAEMAKAGADFVAVEHAVWSDPRGTQTALMDAADTIGHSSAPGRERAMTRNE